MEKSPLTQVVLLAIIRWIRYPPFEQLAPVVQTLDSAIHWINHYPLDNSIGFASVYLLDSDLSGGQRYPSFEQLRPGARSSVVRVKFENVYPQSDLGWQCDEILKRQSSQTIGDVKEFEQANMFRRN